MNKIYLDSNSTALLDPFVKDYLIACLSKPLGNPSSFHSFGQEAKALLTSSRKAVANYLKVKSEQVIFTSGGSEGADLCLRGFLSRKPNPHVITSNVEHPCVHETLADLAKKGAEVTYVPVNREGQVAPSMVQEAIRPSTALITIMAANNETGVMNDIEAIGRIAEQAGIPLVVDGVSWLGKEKVVCYPGISAMFFSGHKIHAPQGVGFVYIKDKKKIEPKIKNASQEFGLRGGTENMLGILGVAAAVKRLSENEEAFLSHIRHLRDYFEEQLLQIPQVRLNGSGPRVVNTTNATFENCEGESLLIALDRRGVAASLGSACSSGALEPSRVLLNMGLSPDQARRSLRFSFSRLNTFEETRLAVQIIMECVREYRKQ